MQLPTNTIYLQYNEDGYWTNLPRLIVEYTNDGYQWGEYNYGALDLALNIINWALEQRNCPDGNEDIIIECRQGEVSGLAYVLHGEYARHVIANIPHKGTEIRLQEVWDWIDKVPHFPELPPFDTEENEE